MRFGRLLTAASTLCWLGLVGCGSSVSPVLDGDGGGTVEPRAESGTARLSVDVTSGEVTVSPLDSASRAAFGGSAVRVNSSTLLDEPGLTGLKVLNVSLTNQWGVPIGVQPDGTASGLRVRFSPIVNAETADTDLRDLTDVTSLTSGASAGYLDGAASSARFNNALGLAVGANGQVHIADYGNSAIRRLTSGHVSTTVRGYSYSGVALLPDGALLAVVGSQNRLVRIAPDGSESTLFTAGNGGDGTGVTGGVIHALSIATDASGVAYITEYARHRVRRVSFLGGDPTAPANWRVDTIAGTGVLGTMDGPGAIATFTGPSGITTDPEGNLYVADQAGHRIRQITPGRLVRTIAGTGVAGNANGLGTVATFDRPMGLAWCRYGLLVSDNASVRLMTLRPGAASGNAASWLVRALAGGGASSDGQGNLVNIVGKGIATDGVDNVLICDGARIKRLVMPSGLVLDDEPNGAATVEPIVLANATGQLPTDNDATTAYIDYPLSAPLAQGETTDARMWSFNVPSGVRAFSFTVTVSAATPIAVTPEAGSVSGSTRVLVTTVAGSTSGRTGHVDGPATMARFASARVEVDQRGTIYVCEPTNCAVRRIAPDGTVTTLVGGRYGSADGPSDVAAMRGPSHAAVSPDGTEIYLTDTANHTVRRLVYSASQTPSGGNGWTLQTIVGVAVTPGDSDGLGHLARLRSPYGIVRAAAGELYVTESLGNRVRRIRLLGGDPSLPSNWQVTTIAGSPASASGLVNATGAAARFNAPNGLTLGRDGALYVADYGNGVLRRVTVDGEVTTFCGSVPGMANGAAAVARFSGPMDVDCDAAGYLYVADKSNARIRRISPTGLATTVAGNGLAGAMDGNGATARLVYPQSVSCTPWGDLILSDGAGVGTRIRRIERVMSLGQG